MPRRKKPKPPEAQRQTLHTKVELGERVIDNPLFNPAYPAGKLGNVKLATATVNIRESTVSLLAARRVLSDSQVRAADMFRKLWEAMGGKGASAIDWRKEVVDGGVQRDPISPQAMEAGLKLKRAQQAVTAAHGYYGWKLVTYIAGEGHSVHDLTQTRRDAETMIGLFRHCLDVLAVEWGFATRSKKS